METVLASSLAERRFNMLLLGVFAALALTLAGVGVYGVISYSVAQRTHEIGIRLALGAQSSDVLHLVIRQGMKLIVCGVALGWVGAFWLTGLLAHQLFGVNAHDVTTFIAVTLLLIVVALLACYLPARKAMRVDPLVALREC